MREDPVKGLNPSHSTNARGDAPHGPVGIIDERPSPLPAAVDTPVRCENRDEQSSHQAAEFAVWEDEGGAPAGHPPEFPSRLAKRHFDELST
jgi:hypothetical protein